MAAAAAAASKSGGAAAIKYVAAGWAAFTGTHLAMSHPPVRDALIRQLGDEGRFRGLYSAVSLATFAPTTFLYIRYTRGQGVIPGWTAVAEGSRAVRAGGLALKVAAGVAYGQAISTPNPIMERAMHAAKDGTHDKDGAQGTGAEKEGGEVAVRGIYRITRHALFTSLALLGAGNMLMRPFAGDVVYWAGYPLIWLLGCPHQDMRQRAVLPNRFFQETSFLPFAAIAEGRNSLRDAVKEFNKPVLATSLIVPLFFL
ncbi:hypothetical protein CLOM_g16234 [Closterium sp. NIES-68]|nr:hypothetical protein CLOM_g16234 [Closterium sp. NIES-68]